MQRRASVNNGRVQLPVGRGGRRQSLHGWNPRLRPCSQWLTLTPELVCWTSRAAPEARRWMLHGGLELTAL